MNALRISKKSLDEIRAASTGERLLSLLKELIKQQDARCKRVNPKAWLNWVHKRAGNLKNYEKKYATILV